MLSEKPRRGLFRIFFSAICWLASTCVFAQENSLSLDYPDEAGFQQRISGKLALIAEQPVGRRFFGNAVCPDTGKPFKTLALEGEQVYSPFTGSAIIQGSTGYFGAKERGEDGRITRFGGDALKKELAPATARLLLGVEEPFVKAFLGIPGNMNQQYHFAAKNWARFYPLLSDQMSQTWENEFQRAVAAYTESTRPSDGYRVYDPLSTPHNLVGEPGELLGGNKKDGGTENHKVMWRSSAWVYSHYFPEGSRISRWPIHEVDSLSKKYFRGFLKGLLTTGNGEYDSEIYYPHSIAGLLNIYDFCRTDEAKELAQAILDYYLITLSIKSYDGALSGAQKRGPNLMNQGGELNTFLHYWFGSALLDGDHPSLHQITSSYRPNGLIWNLYHKNIKTPFELKIARPTYHMDQANDAQEYFYGSKNFGLGSVYLNRLDNPNQQVQWSLVYRTQKGPATLGGGQPYHGSPGGHSPYTQTMQHGQTILVAAGDTRPVGSGESEESYQRRLVLGKEALRQLELPPLPENPSFEAWMNNSRFHQACWLFVPKGSGTIHEIRGRIFLHSDETYLSITPFSPTYYWITASDSTRLSGKLQVFEKYDVLVVTGSLPGYALEVYERDDFSSFADLVNRVQTETSIQVDSDSSKIVYHNTKGCTLEMEYQHNGLRAEGSVDGMKLDFQNWSPAGVYTSDLLKVGNGLLELELDGEIQHIQYDDRDGVTRK